MIRKRIDENAAYLVPEDSDDLLALRRIIKTGDRITSDTTRTIKLERDNARPDKGRRVRVRVAVRVEKVSLDHSLDRLRVGGTILESNNESVPHGSHHSLTLRPGEGCAVSKKKWSASERRLSRSSGSADGFVLLAIDTAECGIARLRGTHLELLPNMYSGAGGKRYKTSFDISKFFEQARRALDAARSAGDAIVVFGPGHTKKKFANFLQKAGYAPRLAEGIDSAGQDGIYAFTRSQAMKDMMSGSKLARVSDMVDEIMMLANKKSKKFTMGLAETLEAERAGAIRTLAFSDKAIQESEDAVIGLLDRAESGGAATFGVDSSTDLGLRITGLGGIVSLLRYAVRT